MNMNLVESGSTMSTILDREQGGLTPVFGVNLSGERIAHVGR